MTEFKKGTFYFQFKSGTREAYTNHPEAPKITLDDLGFPNQRDIPSPGVYVRKPCSCGVQHAWTDKGEQTFSVDILHAFTRPDGEKFYFPVKRCKKCDEVLMMQLEEEEIEK